MIAVGIRIKLFKQNSGDQCQLSASVVKGFEYYYKAE